MTTEQPQQFQFRAALEKVEIAIAHRAILDQCWAELCDAGALDIRLGVSDAVGRLDVVADWPDELATRADDASLAFSRAIGDAFDEALFTAADLVSASVQRPQRDDYRMPLLASRAELGVVSGPMCIG